MHSEYCHDVLANVIGIIDSSIETLEHLQRDIESEETIKPVGLHHLHDMVEDIAEAVRTRRAETNLAWRHTGM